MSHGTMVHVHSLPGNNLFVVFFCASFLRLAFIVVGDIVGSIKAQSCVVGLGGGVRCGWVFGLLVGGAGACLGRFLAVGSGGLGVWTGRVGGWIGRKGWPVVCAFIFVACVCLLKKKKDAARSALITSFAWH